MPAVPWIPFTIFIEDVPPQIPISIIRGMQFYVDLDATGFAMQKLQVGDH